MRFTSQAGINYHRVLVFLFLKPLAAYIVLFCGTDKLAIFDFQYLYLNPNRPYDSIA